MENILFIGNSFTFVNDLPGMMEALTDPAKLLYHYDSVTKGGAYLHQFADEEHELGIKVREKLAERKWDWVILQDQSFNPAKDADDCVRSAETLAKLTGAAKLLLYQTWAYEDGTEKLSGTGLCYEEMRLALRDGYEKAAQAVGGRRIPVGDAFAEVYRAHPEIALYLPDHYHPAPSGTYLAAMLFADAITGSYGGLKVPDGVNSGDEAALKAAVRLAIGG